MCRRGAGLHRDGTRVGVEFLQGTGQGGGVAGEVSAGSVRLVFARARHSKLNQGRGDGSDDQHEKRGKSSAIAAVAATTSEAAEEHGPASNAGPHGGCAGQSRSYGADQDVAVVDVA